MHAVAARRKQLTNPCKHVTNSHTALLLPHTEIAETLSTVIKQEVESEQLCMRSTSDAVDA
jgi:hypothetical protein